MYDVEKLFVENESLVSRGLTEDDLSVDVKVIDSSEMKKLMSDSEVVFNF
jgi:tRNA 2-thiouridine synthesizing protein C